MAELSLLAIMAPILIALSLAADDPQSELVGELGCSPNKYVNTTAFTENLDSVLQSLLSNLSSDGFATSMQHKYGKTDPVYGLAVCRKYLSAHECSECFTEAKIQAARLAKLYCSQPNGIRIHLDGCFLRYENNSFYDQDLDVGDYSYCSSTNASDPQTFSQTAQALSRQLTKNASANKGFSVGSINGLLYGLAQCWPSLTSGCQTCLTAAQNQLLTCPPRIEGRGLEAGCFMRYSTYPFSPDNHTSSSTNLTPSSGKSASHIATILIGIIGGKALVAVLCLVYFYGHIRHQKNNDQAGGYISMHYIFHAAFHEFFNLLVFDTYQKFVVIMLSGANENLAARGNFEEAVFDYEILRDSTGNFDRNNMLGKGGYGEVYKGTLPDGMVVAVKKLNGNHETIRAVEEFLREVRLLTSVRHRNLVRLLGCSTRGHERLLVYEFMSNNSLHKHLFGETRTALSWENRLNIILGTARGLAYLHEESNLRIIHRDIKCANILLDDSFRPKIADFGLGRFFPENETHVSTRVLGTIGYIAPEYAIFGQLTEKADIYSYGIVVLEILSGRKCTDERLPAPVRFLLQWAWNQFKRDQVLDIVDPTLERRYPREEALRVITIALLCAQGSSAVRPAMSRVVSMLTNNLEIPVQPIQPGFIDHVNETESQNSSLNETGSQT